MFVPVSGNQQTRPNVVASWTDDDLTSPVTAVELAVYLGLIDDENASGAPQEGMLNGLLLAATQAVIDFTNVEIVQRDWTVKYDRYPDRNVPFGGLAPIIPLFAWWVDLPKWPVVSVNSVTAEEWTADVPTGRVEVSGSEHPLVIEFTAGYNPAPAWATEAIKMIAAYLYEHRGACDATDAVTNSGAKALLRPRRRIVGGL